MLRWFGHGQRLDSEDTKLTLLHIVDGKRNPGRPKAEMVRAGKRGHGRIPVDSRWILLACHDLSLQTIYIM